jgi:competence protein ComEC
MVMLAPHHAAKGSLSENFLRFINPRLAIVSARWLEHRPYPNIGVLNLIAGSGIRVMRTDRDGAVQVRGDGDKLEVSHWTGSKWKTVETFESSR